MATVFTPEQIAQLEHDFEAYLPPEPTQADLDAAPIAERLAFAGTERGLLLHVDTGDAGRHGLFLNPIVARTLLEGISEAGLAHKWWAMLKHEQIPLAPDLTRADLENAEQVYSLRTGSTPTGLLIVCGSERGAISFFMRPNFAAATAYSIDETSKRAEWWGPNDNVVPIKSNMN